MIKTDLARQLSTSKSTGTATDAALTHENEKERQARISEDAEQPGDSGPCAPRLLSTPLTTGPAQPPRQRPPPATAGRLPCEYLTRRQAAAYVNYELGRPMSFSTASKLAALGEFAEPALWWGKRPLYTRDALRTWAEARSRVTNEHS
jgi:hypothetical protein